jgi:hypothetical protein
MGYPAMTPQGRARKRRREGAGKPCGFATSFSPGKMLKRRLEKSFIVRLFTYNKYG